MWGEWRLGVGKSTGGGIILVSAVLAAGLVFTGWQIGDMRDQGGPLLAERGPLPQDPTAWPSTSGDSDEQSQQGAIAPGPPPESGEATESPSESPRPVPVPTGRWTGTASVTISGGDQGCRATTKTFRTPATLRLESPLRGDGNAVRVSFESDNPAAEGSFRVSSSVPSTGRTATRWWTLSGNGAGGFVGQLHRPAEDPVQDVGEIDNLLFATRSLDQQCGALLSAPLSFPLGSGSSLRLTSQGAQRSILLTGRTSDTTRTFQIAWASI
ncbi:hypothetical protein [Cryptosporangium sp. NPDC048952]|uniref:hypothetical protein n=1 Tax=Cryptosporangium sp. NPDC048952 TaxID=3363961 RepID=UPI003716F6C9